MKALSATLGLSCAVFILSGCRPPTPDKKQEEPQVQEQPQFLVPVRVATLERGEIRATIGATGSIVPLASEALNAEENGVLHFSQPWREGDSVAKGEVIATIESRELESQLEIDRAEIRAAEQTLSIARTTRDARIREYQTLQDLYVQGIAAQREVDGARLAVDQSTNEVSQAKINLDKANHRLESDQKREERLVIAAPYDGVLVTRATLRGEGKFQRGFGTESLTNLDGRSVSAGTLICGIVDISNVLMRCDLTSKDVGRVEAGQSAVATIFAQQDVVREGEVARISNSVDPDTRAFTVDILLHNEDEALKPGMFGRAEIVTERRRDRIVVPKDVISRRNNQDVVFVARKLSDSEAEVAEMVSVEIGLQGRDDVEIANGLVSGDRVVVSGYELLQDQTPINAISVDEPVEQ